MFLMNPTKVGFIAVYGEFAFQSNNKNIRRIYKYDMKKNFSCVFTITGAVVGAGFISGRELIRFFGTENFIPSAFIAAVLFALFIYALLRLGYKCGGFSGGVSRMPKIFKRVFLVFIYSASFIMTSGMLAGADSLFSSVSPFVGIVFIVLIFFICRFGIKGLNIVNFILVPVILSCIAVTVIKNSLFSFGGEVEPLRIYSAFSYVGMNIFLSFPIVCDMGKNMDNKKGVSSLFVAGVLFILILLVLFAVKSDKTAIYENFPLVCVLKKYSVFPFICLFASFTSLCSSFYPLYNLFAENKAQNVASGVLLATAFLVSRIGFFNIVEHIYPIIGCVGFSLSVACIFYNFLFKKSYQSIHTGCHNA